MIIFESNLRKYRELLIEGESFILGVDFSSQNGSLKGELKKIFSINEVERLNNVHDIKTNKEGKQLQQTIKIYTDGNFSKNELSKLKWVKGHNKVEIIMNNQLLRIPGQFNITTEMINQMKNLNGVKKIDFAE